MKNSEMNSQGSSNVVGKYHSWKRNLFHFSTPFLCLHPLSAFFLPGLPPSLNATISSFPPDSIPSRQSNALNLNRHALRQLINRHTAPRRLMLKELLINTIHLREIIHRRQKDIDFDHLLDRGAGSAEDGGQVLDAELGHRGDGGGFEGQDLAGGPAGDLA